jgi:hypothetical protein
VQQSRISKRLTGTTWRDQDVWILWNAICNKYLRKKKGGAPPPPPVKQKKDFFFFRLIGGGGERPLKSQLDMSDRHGAW